MELKMQEKLKSLLSRIKKHPKKSLGLAVGILLSIGGLVFGLDYILDNAGGVSKVRVSNISATSATVSWVTEEEKVSEVYVSEGGWFPVIESIGKNKELDDRDIEINKDGDYVVKQEGEQERYTHHVTIRNLKPETEYEFKISSGKKLVTPEDNKIKTSQIEEEITTPDPVYQRLINVDEALTDGVVYYRVKNGNEESDIYSTTINNEGNWSGDLSKIKKEGGKILVEVETGKLREEREYELKEYKPLPTMLVVNELDKESEMKSQEESSESAQVSGVTTNSITIQTQAEGGKAIVLKHDYDFYGQLKLNGVNSSDFLLKWEGLDAFNQLKKGSSDYNDDDTIVVKDEYKTIYKLIVEIKETVTDVKCEFMGDQSKGRSLNNGAESLLEKEGDQRFYLNSDIICSKEGYEDDTWQDLESGEEYEAFEEDEEMEEITIDMSEVTFGGVEDDEEIYIYLGWMEEENGTDPRHAKYLEKLVFSENNPEIVLSIKKEYVQNYSLIIYYSSDMLYENDASNFLDNIFYGNCVNKAHQDSLILGTIGKLVKPSDGENLYRPEEYNNIYCGKISQTIDASNIKFSDEIYEQIKYLTFLISYVDGEAGYELVFKRDGDKFTLNTGIAPFQVYFIEDKSFFDEDDLEPIEHSKDIFISDFPFFRFMEEEEEENVVNCYDTNNEIIEYVNSKYSGNSGFDFRELTCKLASDDEESQDFGETNGVSQSSDPEYKWIEIAQDRGIKYEFIEDLKTGACPAHKEVTSLFNGGTNSPDEQDALISLDIFDRIYDFYNDNLDRIVDEEDLNRSSFEIRAVEFVDENESFERIFMVCCNEDRGYTWDGESCSLSVPLTYKVDPVDYTGYIPDEDGCKEINFTLENEYFISMFENLGVVFRNGVGFVNPLDTSFVGITPNLSDEIIYKSQAPCEFMDGDEFPLYNYGVAIDSYNIALSATEKKCEERREVLLRNYAVVVDGLIVNGVAMEVSPQGLRRDPLFLYPNKEACTEVLDSLDDRISVYYYINKEEDDLKCSFTQLDNNLLDFQNRDKTIALLKNHKEVGYLFSEINMCNEYLNNISNQSRDEGEVQGQWKIKLPDILGINASRTDNNISEMTNLIPQINASQGEETGAGRYSFFLNGEKIYETDAEIDGDSLNLRVFEDTNANGRKDEGEEFIEGEEKNITFKKEATAREYQINSGWNLVHIPLVDNRDSKLERVNSASRLLEYWNEKGLELLHIAKYEGGRFIMYSKRESGNGYSQDFTILPGEGLFVFNAGVLQTVTFTGAQLEESMELDLENGWNLIGIAGSSEDYDSEKLLSVASEQGIKADTLSQFENGIYQSVIKEEEEGTLYGNNFNLIEQRGYFIRVDSQGSKIKF